MMTMMNNTHPPLILTLGITILFVTTTTAVTGGAAFLLPCLQLQSQSQKCCFPHHLSIIRTFQSASKSSSPSSSSSSMLSATIISPFDDSVDRESDTSAVSTTYTTTTDPMYTDEILDLTWENVELVLEEMRPYLIQDGGNVAIQDIDGPVVRLELQGACGTCPSSTQTMKMGLERRLKERIPEIQEVVQSLPQGPPLVMEQVNVILDGVRPFLNVAGGSIDCDRITGVDGLQPTIWLNMQGSASMLNSVKLEISQRLQRHFMLAGLRVEWL